MKIAIFDIDDIYNPHWGSGSAKVTREVAKRLARKHIITVYSSRYPGSRDYIEDKIFYKHIGVGTYSAIVNNFVYILSVPFAVLGQDADLIIENFTAPISTCFIPLFVKTPVIGISSFFASEEMSRKYKINFSFIEKIGVKYYKYFIALNKKHQQKMKSLNPKILSTVISNGIDDRYLTLKTTEKNYILYIGRIDVYQKGLDLLLMAYKKASDVISDELWIMGKGSPNDESTLSELITKLKLQKRVKLLGKKEGKEKDAIFASCKYTVFPSRYEGQSLSALESLSLGKPIICFAIAEFGWVSKEVSLKAKKFLAEDFAKQMIIMSTEPKLRDHKKIQAREIASEYTWEKTAKLYERFIAKVFSDKQND